MIAGTIINNRAYINLRVENLTGQQSEVEFVLDTGFTGIITLPPTVCTALGLTFARYQPSHLADGTPRILEVYEAVLLWDGEYRNVEVLALEGAPLIGMLMLRSYEVRMQVEDNGLVTIELL